MGSADLLKALEPEFDDKEEDIAKHDYRNAQAVAIEKISEAQMLQRFNARTGQKLNRITFWRLLCRGDNRFRGSGGR